MLEKTLHLFLEKHVSKNARLLIAFSGGPDSFCLAHLLMRLKSFFSFEIELAHIDHGQRKESRKEAIALKQWAEKNQIPFHLETLNETQESNLEALYREKRYAFFRSLFKRKNYDALLLAHHQNDLEETVLKRLLEGASFENLCSLKEVSTLNEMTLWRPLLPHTKDEILHYVHENQLPVVVDYTNFNSSNLRSKMRMGLLPMLEQSFGKKIRSNLIFYSKYSSLYKDFMDERVDFEPWVKSSALGYYLDLSRKKNHLFEMVYGLKKILKKRGIVLHRQALIQAAECLKNKKLLKKMVLKNWQLYFDRGRLIILSNQHAANQTGEIELHEGVQFWGSWRIEVSKTKEEAFEKVPSWEDLFKKEIILSVQIPEGQYVLREKDLKNDRLSYGKRLQNYLAEKKIPSCLISLVPVVVQNKKVITEFLSGKQNIDSKKAGLNISLSYKKD